MNKPKSPQEWQKEFSAFLNAPASPPPAEITAAIQARVYADLCPKAPLVLAKMLILHAAAGFLTLFYCPQFGFSFSQGPGLMKYFMSQGELLCHFLCGAFFIGTGALALVLFLGPGEIKILRKKKFLHWGILSLFSLSLLVCFGIPPELSPTLIWIAGALVGGLVIFEGGIKLRKFISDRRKLVH